MAAPSIHQPQRLAAHGAPASLAIFCVGFVVLLAIALTARLLFMNWRDLLPGAEGAGGLIDGVTSAVYSFMSNIP